MLERAIETRQVYDSRNFAAQKKMIEKALRTTPPLIQLLHEDTKCFPNRFIATYSSNAHHFKPAREVGDLPILEFAGSVADAWVRNPTDSLAVARDSSVFEFFGPKLIVIIRAAADLMRRVEIRQDVFHMINDTYGLGRSQLDAPFESSVAGRSSPDPFEGHPPPRIRTPPRILDDGLMREYDTTMTEVARRLIVGFSPLV